MQIRSRGTEMTGSLNSLVAAEHTADLRRAAEQHRWSRSGATSSPNGVALRLADSGDAHELKILAELDEAPELSGEALLAVIDGEPVAAMSLADGRVIANPFVATSDAVTLLRLRAEHVLGRTVRRTRRRWHPRFA
jgi:hypothetical protein